jgi:hypothetical protein
LDAGSQQLACGVFAEGAAFSLKRGDDAGRCFFCISLVKLFCHLFSTNTKARLPSFEEAGLSNFRDVIVSLHARPSRSDGDGKAKKGKETGRLRPPFGACGWNVIG